MDAAGITKLVVMAIYLILMIIIGIFYFKRTNSLSDYILGGRSIGGWTGALSAQASDMSGWLLLGLPGAAYASGLEAGWIAIGLALGTYANWKFVAIRLRRYTQIAGDSLTLSDFFENRFKDKSHVLRVVSAIFILIFFVVYTSAQFAAGGKLFNLLMGVPYQLALVIGVIVIVSYTFLGGFLAVCRTDFIQGMLMFFALIIVPFVAIAEMGGFGQAFSSMAAVDSNFLSLIKATGGGALSWIAIVSSLAWGLGYFGQPHILTRFMAIKSSKEIKKARIIAMVWVIIALCAAVFVGMIGRIYMDASAVVDGEKVFMLMVDKMFVPVIAGILLAAILAASMSTADSQLLVTASTVSKDFYKQFFNKNATDKQQVFTGRITVIIVAVIAALIASDPESSVFGLVSYAWAGFGAAFGPIIIISLFWKRMNRAGAIAGVVTGGITVIAWILIRNAIQAAGNLTDGSILNLYELVPGFLLAVIAIFIGSLITAAPSKEIIEEFESVDNCNI